MTRRAKFRCRFHRQGREIQQDLAKGFADDFYDVQDNWPQEISQKPSMHSLFVDSSALILSKSSSVSLAKIS